VRPDVVAHLAAIAFVGHGDVEQIYRVNVAGTRNLLEALAALEHKPSAVLLASSANIYGNAEVASSTRTCRRAGQRLRGQQAGDGIHGAPVAWTSCRSSSPAIQLHRRRPDTRISCCRRSFALPPQGRRHRAGQPGVSRATFPTCAWSLPATASCWPPAPATSGHAFNICSGHAYSLGEALDMMADIAGYKIERPCQSGLRARQRSAASGRQQQPSWWPPSARWPRTAGRHAALDVFGVSAAVSGEALRIGLSTTMIEPALTGGRLDGIGVYTRALLEHLPHAGVRSAAVFLCPTGRRAAADGRPRAAAIVRTRRRWATCCRPRCI
jgi:hypothetical protein